MSRHEAIPEAHAVPVLSPREVRAQLPTLPMIEDAPPEAAMIAPIQPPRRKAWPRTISILAGWAALGAGIGLLLHTLSAVLHF